MTSMTICRSKPMIDMAPMTPKQFEVEMLEAEQEPMPDLRQSLIEMTISYCLRSNGFGKGIDVLNRMRTGIDMDIDVDCLRGRRNDE